MLQRPVESTQYASKDFRDVLKDYGITGLMSRRGNCSERQRLQRNPVWIVESRTAVWAEIQDSGEAKDENIAWLLWNNRPRLHSTLACVSPVQFEQNWLANQPMQANS